MESITRTAHLFLSAILPKNRWGDTVHGMLVYAKTLRRIPCIRNPVTFNDHLLRMKWSGELYDPVRQFISDKEFFKLYISAAIGEGYTAKTLGIIESESELASFQFPIPCVVKPTHASGFVEILLHPEKPVDRAKLATWLDVNHYNVNREAVYKYLRPKLIVEEFLDQGDGQPPKDYKFLCFRGEPQLIQVDSNRLTRHTRNIYSPKWDLLPIKYKYRMGEAMDPRPSKLDEMIKLARRLSAPFEFIRVDFYQVNGKIFIGEMTNCPENATGAFDPIQLDFELADLFEGKGISAIDFQDFT